MIALLIAVLLIAAPAHAALVLHLRFDDGPPSLAADDSGSLEAVYAGPRGASSRSPRRFPANWLSPG